MIKVHHLNCISTCPIGGKWMDGQTRSWVKRGHLACHCLLIESNVGLILVDTGLGLKDVQNPKSRLSQFFLSLLKPDSKEELTAVRQVEALGFKPREVRHILLTHLDFDHAGGLDDFPQARVHLMQSEWDSAAAQKTWLDRQRFRPQQWASHKQWRGYTLQEGERWFGFERVVALEGLPPEIALIPLIGHTYGHAGIAIQKEEKWLFLTGDAYFYHSEMDTQNPYCTSGLRVYQSLMEKNRGARLWNQERLRNLCREYADEISMCCSHDVLEFERLSGRSIEVPVQKMNSIISDSTLKKSA